MPDSFQDAVKAVDSFDLTKATSNASDAPFSAEDRDLIQEQMKQLREYIEANRPLTVGPKVTVNDVVLTFDRPIGEPLVYQPQTERSATITQNIHAIQH